MQTPEKNLREQLLERLASSRAGEERVLRAVESADDKEHEDRVMNDSEAWEVLGKGNQSILPA